MVQFNYSSSGIHTFTKPNPDSLITISPNMQYTSAVVGRSFCQKLTL